MIPYTCSTLVQLSNIQELIYSREKIEEIVEQLENVCARSFDIHIDSDSEIDQVCDQVNSAPVPGNWIVFSFNYCIWVCHLRSLFSWEDKRHKLYAEKTITQLKCSLCRALFETQEQVKEHYREYECVAPTIFCCMNTDLELHNPRNVDNCDGLIEWP